MKAFNIKSNLKPIPLTENEIEEILSEFEFGKISKSEKEMLQEFEVNFIKDCLKSDRKSVSVISLIN